MKTAKGILVFVGVAAIIVAGLGICYNIFMALAEMISPLNDPEREYFYPAFYIMTIICIGCYLALIMCGIQFIRLKTNLLTLFAGIIAFEVVYYISVGLMWLIPVIGKSIAMATGVANGGMMVQAITLFPIWAPGLALWSVHRLKRE